MNYRHNAVQSNYLNNYTREDRLGIYLQDEWKLADSLTAVVGVRYDLDTFINPTISPRASLIFRPWNDHTFRTGVAVGYRPPTIFESRLISNSSANIPIPAPPFSITVPGAPAVGSDQLAPEQISSFDLGYQGWYLKHRLRTRLDLFFNHVSDLIGTSGLVTPSTYFNGSSQRVQGQGGGSADIYGGEAGIEILATSWLTGFANYSYQEIRQTYQITNRVTRGAPNHKFSAGGRIDLENGFNGEAAIHYYGASTYPIDPTFALLARPPFNAPPPPNQRVDSYTLLNVRAAYKIWRERSSGREVELAVTGFNSLNDRHKEHPLGQILGSRVMGWITMKY